MKIPSVRRKYHRILMFFLLFFLLFYASAALGSSGGGHEAEPKGWVATDTYRVMNFTVLAVVLFLLLRKPVSNALSNRIKGIKEQLEDLEMKKQEAEKELADYEQKLSALDKEAEKIISDYIRQGNEAKQRILEEAKASAQKLEEQAKKSIEHEFKEAKLKLQQDILEKALLKAEDVIKSSITDEDQEKLVDEYLEKVVAQ